MGTGVGVVTGAFVDGEDFVGWEVAVGGMGVGEGSGTVGATVGAAVAGTGVEVEPEQAATNTANIDRKSIEAHRRLNLFGRVLKMLTSVLRAATCRWM